MNYILGVDAGATKTIALIADNTGKTLGQGKGGPANIHHVQNEKQFQENIKEAVENAKKDASVEIKKFAAACFGIAGVDTEKLREKAKNQIAEIINLETRENLLILNDIKLIRPSCSEYETGVSVIVGTGSNFYGVNAEGEEAYAGGLDHLLSDEGSAYWIGWNVLHAAVKSFDGRGEKTLLEELLLKEFGANSIRELANIVYAEGFGKDNVASIAKLVDAAYTEKDAVAERILDAAAEEAALAINTLIKKLDLKKEDFDIVAAGGEFRSPYPFAEKIKEKLILKNTEFIVCHKSPAEGAVKLASNMLE